MRWPFHDVGLAASAQAYVALVNFHAQQQMQRHKERQRQPEHVQLQPWSALAQRRTAVPPLRAPVARESIPPRQACTTELAPAALPPQVTEETVLLETRCFEQARAAVLENRSTFATRYTDATTVLSAGGNLQERGILRPACSAIHPLALSVTRSAWMHCKGTHAAHLLGRPLQPRCRRKPALARHHVSMPKSRQPATLPSRPLPTRNQCAVTLHTRCLQPNSRRR